MAFKAEPISRPREQVEQQLREAIMSSVLKPGQRLPSETQLATEFKVSRATIREALRSLAADGLISKQQGSAGGSFVQKVDHESLAADLSVSMDTILRLGRITLTEIEYVRQILEVPAARLAAENRTRDQLAELERLLQVEPELDPDDPSFAAFDLEFHGRVAAAGGNRVLLALFTGLARAQRGSAPTAPVKYVDSGADALAAIHDQHRALVAAIAAGDPDAAGRIMAAHISYFGETVEGDPVS
ncbi:FadR/GntR family transcriptional regulator [Streptomyces sp. NPDC058464]|uniref:FadR/GntR family transcriptional regulator n=1 Tax=Streptomyces sp. NPDC058464 TaxID=3346511 RepID=UPI003659EF6C